MTRQARGSRLLCSLLLFVLFTAGVAPFNWDLPEPRSRASKIRVHPRGNLWATGHFMGKKSLEPPGLSLVGTASPSTQRGQRLQLSHDLLRILLLKKALGMNLSGSTSPVQEAAGANPEEVTPLTGSTQQRGLECVHLGKLLNATPAVAPSGCKS
ncbi:neuromedin-B isoform X1 [Mesocricetus auratus]|uniref:Neuromedin-B isoform X1 n=1 Tax=Mesocricetus auratus TaxID=10036 RepID=A0A1U7R215_MESAU|nr:neuromedin-B isoform X1 [Mesocricetus auratus]